MNRVKAFFKTWVTDGWLTTGAQVACPPGQARMFTRCLQCGGVFPHWWASMTVEEIKQRGGKIGCRCGGIRIQPCLIPAWQSIYWFVVKGWLIRKVLLRARVWDPRMVVLERDSR
jgi:hypothetical protein